MFESLLLTTQDDSQWCSILDDFSLKDPFYLPGYLKAFEKLEFGESYLNFGGQGFLFVFGDARNRIIYPFFKRRLSDIREFGRFNQLFDIVSPYGYGGPLGKIENENLVEDLWSGYYKAFDSYCAREGIISEFCRLHPIYRNHLDIMRYGTGQVVKRGELVYVNVRLTPEELLASMTRQRRQHVLKSLRNPEMDYNCTSGLKDYEYFFDLYTDTMKRKGAEKKFFFNREFFKSIDKLLAGNMFTLETKMDNKVIASVVNLNFGDIAYTWLSASDVEHLDQHPNEVLIYLSAVEARKKGCKNIILGGGVGGTHDSLFRYKIAFSGLTEDFYSYQKIHQPREYDELTKMRNHSDEVSQTGFFPAYRSYVV
jgi:hypothetical protein